MIIISPNNNKQYLDNKNKADNSYLALAKGEINVKDYLKDIKLPTYNIAKFGATATIIDIICLVGYFGIYQYINQGQTLGKKLFKIIIRNKQQKEITINQMIIRSIINNGVYVLMINLLLVLIIPVSKYYIYNQAVLYFGMLISYISFGLIIFTKKGRGLHDLVAQTIVKDKE